MLRKRVSARSLVVGAVAAMVVVLLPEPASAAKPRPPSSGPPPLVGAEFNLNGWQQHAGGIAPAVTVVEQVQAAKTKPAMVAVVETCSSDDVGQWEHIKGQLGPLGYSFVWSPSIPDFDRVACGQYGNGLAVLGSVSNVVRSTFIAQRVSETSSYQELRNIVCASSTAPDGAALTACATHLVNQTSGDEETTRAQAAEALQFVRDHVPGRRLIGGDFNLAPSEAALDGWYAAHFEADASRRTRRVKATHDSGRKLDYVFGDVQSFSSSTSASVTPQETSDHHWFSGSFPAP